MRAWPGGHSVRSGKCHPLRGRSVVVMDVKARVDMPLIGRSGVIHHDPDFGRDYLAFDDGGSCNPEQLILDELIRRPSLTPRADVCEEDK